jgi:hypothetical protein
VSLSIPIRRTLAARFLVECYWPGITAEELKRMEARIELAQRQMAGMAGTPYLGAILVPADEAVFCLYAAPTAEEVRQAAERADTPIDRIKECLLSRILRTRPQPTEKKHGERQRGHGRTG